MKKKRRTYVQKARAQSSEETRQRIVVAAMQLHERLGPAATSIAAIADEAGVQRLTVYRHFPDEMSLLRACGGHYRALHPPPDLGALRDVPAGRERVEAGLLALYTHFRETRAMWSHVLRDADVSDVVRAAATPRFEYLRAAAALLGEAWPATLARAAIGHAVQFRTWESLANEGLDDALATELMTRLVLVASS